MIVVSTWLRIQAFLAPPAILLATVLLWWTGGYTDSLSMAGLVPLGVLVYAAIGAAIEGGGYMVLWALEQRRKWQEEREQRMRQWREAGREEGRQEGREELAQELRMEAREGESAVDLLDRIERRHAAEEG